jgi:hypothetical protein
VPSCAEVWVDCAWNEDYKKSSTVGDCAWASLALALAQLYFIFMERGWIVKLFCIDCDFVIPRSLRRLCFRLHLRGHQPQSVRHIGDWSRK